MGQREIRFRVWDQVGKQMVNLDRLDITGDLVGWADDENGTEYPFDAPVMQFTGLHDKNGKEIWEGDVVRWPLFDPDESKREPIDYRKEIVTFKDACFWPLEFHGKQNLVEVLGNIHENPELISHSPEAGS